MKQSSRITGADLVWSTLQQLGLRTVFGVPGTQTVPLYDALRHTDLRTVLSTSELAGAFAANGYYRASGRPAALVTIPGPGTVMAATGLIEALHDSVALLHLTVRKPGKRPPFDLQQIDMQAFAAACSKATYHLESSDDIADTIVQAWHTAQSAEPGPVIVEIDLPVVSALTPAVHVEYRPAKPSPADTADVVSRLLAANKPLFICGQGCFGITEQFRRLIEQLHAPVIPTCSGRGILSDDHPLVVPVDYANAGWTIAQTLCNEADLILVLGAKLSHNGSAGFRLTLDKDKLIHVDASGAVLNTNYPASTAITADLRTFLPHLVKAIDTETVSRSGWTEERLNSLKTELATRIREGLSHVSNIDGARPDTIESLFEALAEQLSDDAIVVADSGMHQIATRAYWVVRKERGLIVPSDFQSMGYGMPAAVGAALAQPDRHVVAVVGDGGMLMTGNELGVAVRERLDLTAVVFSDGYLGQIRMQQLTDSGTDQAVQLPPMELASLATGLGLSYARLEGDLTGAIQRALSLPAPRLIELPLVDSPRLDRIRRIQTARQQARRLLGPSAGNWLKRLLGRF